MLWYMLSALFAFCFFCYCTYLPFCLAPASGCVKAYVGLMRSFRGSYVFVHYQLSFQLYFVYFCLYNLFYYVVVLNPGHSRGEKRREWIVNCGLYDHTCLLFVVSAQFLIFLLLFWDFIYNRLMFRPIILSSYLYTLGFFLYIEGYHIDGYWWMFWHSAAFLVKKGKSFFSV